MFLIRVLGIFAMCAAASWSVLLGIEDVSTAKLTVTAERLESKGFAAEFSTAGLDTDRALSTCRSPILKAAIAIAFADITAQQKLGDQSAWLTTRQHAGAIVDHARECLPNDGGIWASSAQLFAASANWPKTLEGLRNSQRLAPTDDTVLQARVETWAKVPSAIARQESASFRSDARVVLQYGRLELVRLLLASMPYAMLAVVRSEVETLAADRRQWALQLLPVLAETRGVAA